MSHQYKVTMALAVTILAILFAAGCQPHSASNGIHVMFAETPRISYENAYLHSQAIGTVTGTQVGPNGIAKVTVRLDPRFEKQAGHHWAFYVERGRLMAERLSVSGGTVSAGDPVCGFSSRGALKWFKVKTLLKDRVANAMRRADRLHRRFG